MPLIFWPFGRLRVELHHEAPAHLGTLLVDAAARVHAVLHARLGAVLALGLPAAALQVVGRGVRVGLADLDLVAVSVLVDAAHDSGAGDEAGGHRPRGPGAVLGPLGRGVPAGVLGLIAVLQVGDGGDALAVVLENVRDVSLSVALVDRALALAVLVEAVVEGHVGDEASLVAVERVLVGVADGLGRAGRVPEAEVEHLALEQVALLGEVDDLEGRAVHVRLVGADAEAELRVAGRELGHQLVVGLVGDGLAVDVDGGGADVTVTASAVGVVHGDVHPVVGVGVAAEGVLGGGDGDEVALLVALGDALVLAGGRR